MASEWRKVPLGELTENFDSRRVPVKGNERKQGPYPYYGASGIVDRVDGYLFDGEFLLIGEDGENLRTRQTPIAFIATGKFWVNNHVHIVRGNHRADTRFLSYVLSQTDISGYLTGSTMPKLTQGNLNHLPVVSPPLPEQKRIAKILGSLDDKIELNRKMNETLEEMARATFKSWFVDFDPVVAKSEGRQPEGMDAETAKLFPDSFVDSEIGRIPKGWKVGKIKDCCTNIQNGGTPRRDTDRFWIDGNIPWLTSGEVRQPIITITSTFITEDGLSESSAKWVAPLSTVIALYGATAGQVSLVSSRLTTNQAVCALIPKPHYEFFNYLWMRRLTAEFENKAVGSAQQNISKGIVEESQGILPPIQVLEFFTTFVTPLFENWISNLHESNTLATLRDAMLPKLLNGEMA